MVPSGLKILLEKRGLKVTVEYAEDVHVISCRMDNISIQSCVIKDTDLFLHLYIYYIYTQIPNKRQG